MDHDEFRLIAELLVLCGNTEFEGFYPRVHPIDNVFLSDFREPIRALIEDEVPLQVPPQYEELAEIADICNRIQQFANSGNVFSESWRLITN